MLMSYSLLSFVKCKVLNSNGLDSKSLLSILLKSFACILVIARGSLANITNNLSWNNKELQTKRKTTTLNKTKLTYNNLNIFAKKLYKYSFSVLIKSTKKVWRYKLLLRWKVKLSVLYTNRPLPGLMLNGPLIHNISRGYKQKRLYYK